MSSRIERALVTGASAGIGTALVRALAERGVEVVLVARRQDRLEALAASLPVASRCWWPTSRTAPTSTGSPPGCHQRRAPVDLLVNDAGLGTYGPLVDQDPDRLQALLDVNVTALVQLTRAVLPQLVARGGGGIINVGSTAAYQPGPYSAVYGATKAFVRSFTEAVHEETRGTGVRVLLLAPGVTRTEFQAVAGVPEGAFPAALTGDADRVAAAALAAFAADRAVCVPAWTDRVAVVGSELLPSSVTRRLRARVLRRYVA
jgi:uncharacterized protein